MCIQRMIIRSDLSMKDIMINKAGILLQCIILQQHWFVIFVHVIVVLAPKLHGMEQAAMVIIINVLLISVSELKDIKCYLMAAIMIRA